MAREYSIWNIAIASLKFWTADLDPVTLGRATECIYTTFFYSPSSYTLCQQSNEILFGCFVITFNAAFDQQLSLADEGYESGSDTINLPTSWRKTPRTHHVSSIEHASFDPALATPCSTPTNSTQASAQMLILQFSKQLHSRQHSRMFRRWRGGPPDGTSRQWTLDFQGNTWKDIMCSWAWSTTCIMSIPMPLC